MLELLPDVPAGKLAIAQVDVSTREEVLALERAGIDAVLVAGGEVSTWSGTGRSRSETRRLRPRSGRLPWPA